MTTLRPGAEAPNHHQPSTCPPNPDASCANCGQTLGDHLPLDGPDGTPDTDSACPTWLEQTFTLMGGEDLDCPSATRCDVCDVTVCEDHSDEFVQCVDSVNVLHHHDCADRCWSCAKTFGAEYHAHLASDR